MTFTRPEVVIFSKQKCAIIQVKLRRENPQNWIHVVQRGLGQKCLTSRHFTMLTSNIWYRSEKLHNHTNLTSQEPARLMLPHFINPYASQWRAIVQPQWHSQCLLWHIYTARMQDRFIWTHKSASLPQWALKLVGYFSLLIYIKLHPCYKEPDILEL